MQKLSEFYTYSKEMSTSVFNIKKKEEIKPPKIELSWRDKLYLEYENIKTKTGEYLTDKKGSWKNKFTDISSCTYFKFDNTEDAHSPWYKKLYYAAKNYFYKLLNLSDLNKGWKNEGDEKEDGIDKNGNKKEESNDAHTIEKTISREFVSYENIDFNKKKQTNFDDVVSNKYSQKGKKRKENDSRYISERSQSELVKRSTSMNSDCSIVQMRSSGVIFNNSNTNDEKDNMNKTSDLINNVNEHHFSNTNETEKMDIKNSTSNEDLIKSANITNPPKFNIKNTWEKISGYIS
ncbi:conserved Plasmodium protein, unknown function [Plasmodium vinckei brucechwatti]|uniref:Uncharacterized protein n=1 Tax=Plasmodium vinckei brucechwatti TaxID=119398 RepID=A0A6V7T4V4_PLAVN|nr:conserved Plasmodium protein, unknown function [Plasmodium vinckei brucechwatti]